MKKAEKNLFIFAGICILALFGSFCWEYSHRNYSLKKVLMADCFQDEVYGVDYQNDTYCIFRTGIDGEAERIHVPIMEKGYQLWIENIVTAKDGKAYVCYTRRNQEETKTEIAYCNFDSGCLETKWDMEQYKGFFTFTKGPDNELEIYCIEGEDRKEIYTTYAVYKYSEAKDRFIRNHGIYTLPEGAYIIGNMEMDMEGRVYRYVPGKGKRMIFENDGTILSRNNILHDEYDGYLHFRNVDTNKNYRVSAVRENPVIEECTECVNIPESLSALGEVIPISMKPTEGSTVALLRNQGRVLPVIYGETEGVIEELTLPIDSIYRKTLIKTAWICLAAFVFLLFRAGILMLNQGVFPIAMKMLLLVLPLTLFSIHIFGKQTQQVLKDNLLNQRKEELYQMGRMQIQSLDIKKYEQLASGMVFEDTEYRRELEYQKEKNDKSFYDSVNEKRITPTGECESLFFALRDGEIYNLTDMYLYNTPVKYFCSLMAYSAMERAMADSSPVFMTYDNVRGMWFAVFSPIYNRTGKMIGIAETRMNVRETVWEIGRQTKQFKRFLVWAIGGISILLMGIILYHLQSLGKLKRAVQEMTDGNLDIQVKPKSNTEITAITRSFNKMARSISGSTGMMKAFQDKYAAFVPLKILQLLGRKDIREIELGDCVEVDAVILTVGSDDFSRYSSKATGQEMFRFINRFFRHILPILQETGGMTAKFTECGTAALYTESPENTLNASISILQELQKEEWKIAGKEAGFSIGICQGLVHLGIIGDENRMEADVVSEYHKLSEFLQRRAGQYGAKLIVTGRVAERIKDFDTSYHHRLLGYIYIHVSENIEKLYDVFDGDDEKQRILKSRTKEAFEQGVAFFMQREFLKARTIFVEILRQNRMDLAAQKYLYLCEQYLNDENGAISLYMEEY